jgi:diguanylate cyclase (GGDEF)-like protein
MARYRRPWYWLVVLVALAVAGTAAIGLNSRSRLSAIDDSFVAGQMVRLQRVEHRIDDYFARAVQLAQVGAAMSAGTVGNEKLVRWYTEQMFAGRADAYVFGLGPFYEPYAFDPAFRLVNIYDHVKTPPRGSPYVHERDGIDEVLYFDRAGRGADDYDRSAWYRAAVAAKGAIQYSGPYWDHGRRYISVTKAFYRRGVLAGVFSVDTLASEFKAMLQRGIAPGDVAWVAIPGQTALIGTAAVPADRSRYGDAQTPLLYSRAYVHLTSDRASLQASERDTLTAAIISVAAIWILTIVTAVGLLQRWRIREANDALRLDQERLEAEIAVARRVESELRKAAYTDALTGLPNRLAFMDALCGVLAVRERPAHAVFLIDLDYFNLTNETLGHPAGDELLRVIAARLADGVAREAVVARLGGDEFAISCACSGAAVERFAASILSAIAEPVVLYGRTVYPHASVGIAVVDGSYLEPQEILRDADIAMYEAKARGRRRYAVFDTEMRDQIGRDAELELNLRRAIERGEIVPYYQPIVDLLTRRTVSFEALARWNHDGEHIAAASFVPFAEARGFIHQIDAAIVRATLGHAKTIFALFPQATIALNVSATELTAPTYAADLLGLLTEHGIRTGQIRLEITETTMMTRADEARETLHELGENGISVVLDDFGTGYSSLSYLQRLSISGLKIDRSFVEHIDGDERSREIVRSIVALAQALGLTTTAEGVERAAQVHELSLLGVNYGQGFFFSPAVAVGALSDACVPDERTAIANHGE